MGWYHAKQILDGEVPEGRLTHVVEPWLLGPGRDSSFGKEFAEWARGLESVECLDSVEKLPIAKGKSELVVVSARSADNGRLTREVLEKGYKAVYLEKPGALLANELEDLHRFSETCEAMVMMGYVKNCAKYVKQLLDEVRKRSSSKSSLSITFVHSNAYKKEELPECFERNCEGALKNMVIHELALIATFFDVQSNSITSLSCDHSETSVQSYNGFEDFEKGSFTIKRKNESDLKIQFDRCGGQYSEAILCIDKQEVLRTRCPDDELTSFFQKKQEEYPHLLPYFITQHHEYIELKRKGCKLAIQGERTLPVDTAGLQVGVEALKLAEELTTFCKNEAKKTPQ
mmetsp:Transcript_402/g.602  ORF Transcript_402/g.602 Transcript_402/m.602 type:complete len:344 (+) Transcript_402:1-1032(+)